MHHAVLFLTASARPEGNAVRLARIAVLGLPQSVTARWLDLQQMNLPPFHDLRPAAPPAPTGALADCLMQIRAASAIVFVAPIYWYGLPAPLHLLLSHWSGWLDNPGLGFLSALREKPAALITARADPDPTVPEAAEMMIRRSAVWLGMRWTGALHGVGDAPGDIARCPSAAAAPGFLLDLVAAMPSRTGVS